MVILQVLQGMATTPGVGVVLNIRAVLQAAVDTLGRVLTGDKHQGFLAQQHRIEGLAQGKRRGNHDGGIQLTSFERLIQRARRAGHYHRFQLRG